MTITFGTQFQVDSAGTFSTVIRMTSTTAICFYSDSADAVSAKHLTLSGSTITAGAKLVIDGTATATTIIRAARMTNTTAMVAYAFGGTHVARVITVSGTTLSASATRNLVDTNIEFASMAPLNTLQVIYIHSDSVAQNGKARIITNFGGSPTDGSTFTYDGDSYNGAITALSATKAVVVFADGANSDFLTGEVLNISGTTITGNADQVLSSVAANQSSIHRIAIDALDSSRAVVAWNDSAGTSSKAIVISESGNALTSGATIGLPAVTAGINLSVGADTDESAIIVGDNTDGIIVHEISVSGTTITRLDNTTRTSGGTVNAAWIAAMSDGIGLATWDATTEAIPVFASGEAAATGDINIENSTNFILNSIEADGDRGGWQANASFANDQDEATYGRRVDIYWTPEGDGVWADEPILAMTGSIIPQSVRFDIRQSGTTFTAVTTDNFLSISGVQGIYFTDTDPSTNC